MKILHVINSLVAAGAENLVVSLANRQVNNNEVSVFTFYSEKDIFADKLNKQINLYSNKKQTYFTVKKAVKLYRVIKKHDVIHVHLFPPLYIVSILSFFLRNKKLIYTEHSTYNQRRTSYFKLIEKIIYSRYNTVVCISKGVSKALKEWIGNKVETRIINNFIDLDLIKKEKKVTRKSLNIKEDSKLIVMVGRFQEEKDHETLIKSLSLLPNDYELLLIGEGEREIVIKKLAKKMSLEKRIHFLGVRKDVISLIKSCDYGVLSSHWEGFGLVILEYMACGLIALGSNIDGLRDVIGEPNCLFENGNEKELSEKILFLEENKKEALIIKKKQRERLANYDINNAVEQYYQVYKGN